MKSSPVRVGLLQAFGIAIYVILFAFFIHNIEFWLKDVSTHPTFNMVLILLLFIISAVVCASLMFGYPISLFFNGEKKIALRIVFWGVIWLLVLFVGMFVGYLIFF